MAERSEKAEALNFMSFDPNRSRREIGAKQVIAFLRGLGIEEPVESYPKRYAAVATDVVSGRKIWLQPGPICDAVRASIALPGVFSPASVDGK